MLNNSEKNRGRPLSPHLTIYRWQISSVLSIFHRLTGIGLFFSLLLVSWIFIYFSFGGKITPLPDIMKFLINSSLFLISFAYFYHTATGLRHLFWDTGRGFSIKSLHQTGWAAVIISILATIMFWLFISK